MTQLNEFSISNLNLWNDHATQNYYATIISGSVDD
jgi:hypothetical protein